MLEEEEHETNTSHPFIVILIGGAFSLLFGMILNHFDVSWFAVRHPDPLSYIPTFKGSNAHYIPSLSEVLVSVGIFSFGIMAFGLAVKHLPVFEEEKSKPH